MGDLARARTHLEQGLSLYDSQQHRALAVLYGHDPGVCCRSMAGIALWLLGYPDQALQHLHAAHALAQELAHPPSLAFARWLAAIAYQPHQETDAAHEQTEALIALATEQARAIVAKTLVRPRNVEEREGRAHWIHGRRRVAFRQLPNALEQNLIGARVAQKPATQFTQPVDGFRGREERRRHLHEFTPLR